MARRRSGEAADGPDGWLLGAIERSMNVLERYSVFKLLKLAFVFLIGMYVFWVGTNQDRVIEQFFANKDKEHTKLMEYRKEIAPDVKLHLNRLLIDLDMDRAFILEFHNGQVNPAGLPFHYGEMTYEEVKDNVSYVGDDYDNLSLSRFNFIDYLYQQKIWAGSIDSLMKIDEKLAFRLRSNDVRYVAMILLRDNKQELGFLGVTSVRSDTAVNPRKVARHLIDRGQALSNLLSAPPSIRGEN